MSKVHFINVDPGDCSIIEHNSGRVTMIDICDGFTPEEITEAIKSSAFDSGPWLKAVEKSANGNFQMKNSITNPVEYLSSLGITSIFRFILSHPDMDHMDGLSALSDSVNINNFWDTGVQKDKPSFSGSPYREEDWDQYRAFVDGKNTKSINRLADERFQFANRGDDNNPGGDGLYILAPNKDLVDQSNATGDVNDASYVILYRSSCGRIIFPGDAHDKTWQYVIDHFGKDVANCSVLIAPHHGRDSDRSYDFLDYIRPKFTIFGNAPSEHLAYQEWNKRDLPFITSNQAGNIVLETDSGLIKIYIENTSFADKHGKFSQVKNDQGYSLYDAIVPTQEGEAVAKHSPAATFLTGKSIE
jgi:competence protein ComEC